jgi:hypothetical protein
MNHEPRMLELLRRAITRPDGFALRDICPADAASFACALDHVVDLGLIERVPAGPHRWFYRVTEAGRVVAEKGKVPRPAWTARVSDVEPTRMPMTAPYAVKRWKRPPPTDY